MIVVVELKVLVKELGLQAALLLNCGEFERGSFYVAA